MCQGVNSDSGCFFFFAFLIFKFCSNDVNDVIHIDLVKIRHYTSNVQLSLKKHNHRLVFHNVVQRSAQSRIVKKKHNKIKYFASFIII